MRKFMITVNGATYEVDVEEVGGAQTAAPVRAAAPVAAAPVAAAPAAPVKAAAPAAAPTATAAGESGKAPMPGNILDVENDIPAPHDGKVVQVCVQKGATVNAGDALVVLG